MKCALDCQRDLCFFFVTFRRFNKEYRVLWCLHDKLQYVQWLYYRALFRWARERSSLLSLLTVVYNCQRFEVVSMDTFHIPSCTPIPTVVHIKFRLMWSPDYRVYRINRLYWNQKRNIRTIKKRMFYKINRLIWSKWPAPMWSRWAELTTLYRFKILYTHTVLIYTTDRNIFLTKKNDNENDHVVCAWKSVLLNIIIYNHIVRENDRKVQWIKEKICRIRWTGYRHTNCYTAREIHITIHVPFETFLYKEHINIIYYYSYYIVGNYLSFRSSIVCGVSLILFWSLWNS